MVEHRDERCDGAERQLDERERHHPRLRRQLKRNLHKNWDRPSSAGLFLLFGTLGRHRIRAAALPSPHPAWLGFLIDLSGTPAISSVTGESNNLTNGPVTFTCQDFDCWLEYKSQSPDCSSPLCN